MTPNRTYLSELASLNWDFEGQNGQEGLAAFHWYPARFIAQVPGLLIGYLSQTDQLVLDPYCGSGTTLVEARRQGRRSIGIDLNPIAVLIAQAKSVEFDPVDFATFAAHLETEILDFESGKGENLDEFADIPNIDEQRQWYHPDTLVELGVIWRCIARTPGHYESVALTAFSGILRAVCSQDKHWGWICDNVKPDRLIYRSAVTMFIEYLRTFGKLFTQEFGHQKRPLPSSNVLRGDSSSELGRIGDGEVDLIVTSPPYLGMTDYVRSQRLSLLWFDVRMDEVKRQESGARYKRHRKNARAEYLNELQTAFREMSRVLKPGGYACFVVGESPTREPVVDRIIELLAQADLQVEVVIRRQLTPQRTFAALVEEKIIVTQKRSSS